MRRSWSGHKSLTSTGKASCQNVTHPAARATFSVRCAARFPKLLRKPPFTPATMGSLIGDTARPEIQTTTLRCRVRMLGLCSIPPFTPSLPNVLPRAVQDNSGHSHHAYRYHPSQIPHSTRPTIRCGIAAQKRQCLEMRRCCRGAQ